MQTHDDVLAAWGDWMTATGLRPRTIGERITTLTALDRTANIYDLAPFDIVAFLGRPGLSQSTRATYHATISAWCRFLRAMRLSTEDPMDGIPAPRRHKSVPRPVTDTQLSACLAAANRRRTRAYVLLAAYEGMRVHEIARTRGEDFDLGRESVTITGKGGKTALIPLHELVVHLGMTMPRTGWWFPAYGRDGHVTGKAVSDAIAGVMTRAGVDATPHQLRHWYGSSLVRSGADLRTTQELMRHSWLTSTQIYTAVDWDREMAALGRLPRVD